MKKLERSRRIFSAVSCMVLGTILVMGSVVVINRLSKPPSREELLAQSEIKFERKKPQQENPKPKPKPKPKPRRSVRTPPNPLASLGTALSGIDFGLPGFDSSELEGLNDELLGGADGVILTDDTVDQPPRATFQAPLQYPPRARSKGTEGYVVLSLLIGLTGEIEQVEVVESFPEGIFDSVVLGGINQWQFEPAQYQGKAVRAWAKQRVRFDLS